MPWQQMSFPCLRSVLTLRCFVKVGLDVNTPRDHLVENISDVKLIFNMVAWKRLYDCHIIICRDFKFLSRLQMFFLRTSGTKYQPMSFLITPATELPMLKRPLFRMFIATWQTEAQEKLLHVLTLMLTW